MAPARLTGEISPRRSRPFAFSRTLPSRCSGGFFVSEAWLVRRIRRRKPERETRIPGSRVQARVANARGLPEGTRRNAGHRWQGEPSRVRFGGAPYLRAPQQNLFLSLVCRGFAAQRTLVVKISDTSHRCGRKARLQSIVPWNLSGEMGASRVAVRSQCQTCVSIVEKTGIACSPACLFYCRYAATRIGAAVVKMSVTSVVEHRTKVRRRRVRILPAERP